MMSIPAVGGKKKLVFFKLKEVEPRKFEARLVGFVKSQEILEEISEKVKRIAKVSGEFIEQNLEMKLFVFRIPEGNNQVFMEAAMEEGCIFRF